MYINPLGWTASSFMRNSKQARLRILDWAGRDLGRPEPARLAPVETPGLSPRMRMKDGYCPSVG